MKLSSSKKTTHPRINDQWITNNLAQSFYINNQNISKNEETEELSRNRKDSSIV